MNTEVGGVPLVCEKVVKVERKKPGYIRRALMYLSGIPYVPVEDLRFEKGEILQGLISMDIGRE